MDREELETTIRNLAETGSYDDAIEAAVAGYGGELLGFLAKVTGREAVAQDAFQDLCVDLWEQLPRFRWQSSFRTWAYRLARGAVRRHTTGAKAREVRLHTDAAGRIPAARWTRTATLSWRKTESRHQLREALAQMDEDDRELVILRIDHRMSWKDIARIVDDEGDGDNEVTRRAAALRKRFERVKDRLRQTMPR